MAIILSLDVAIFTPMGGVAHLNRKKNVFLTKVASKHHKIQMQIVQLQRFKILPHINVPYTKLYHINKTLHK